MPVSLPRHLPYVVRAAAATLNRAGEARVAKHGVTMEQYALLKTLEGEDGLTLTGLRRRLSSDPSTIGAIVARLHLAGLVERVKDARDARSRRVYLTPRARHVLAAIEPDIGPVRARIRRALAPEDAERLLDLLVRLIHAFDPAWPEAGPGSQRARRQRIAPHSRTRNSGV